MHNLNKLEHIIKGSKTLYNLSPYDLADNDGFPTGGGGGGGGILVDTGGGGTGGGGAGTTSSNIGASLSISPNENQSIVTGTTICINASGVLAFPQEAEGITVLDGGCSASSNGNWVKICGTNGAYDAETFDTKLIYNKRSWQITARNSSLNSNSVAPVNVQLLLGVKTTKGYYFYWHLAKNCSNLLRCDNVWLASLRMVTPDGTQTTLNTRYVEYNQLYRLRSDGNAIVWDYTTRNKWAYGVFGIAIPSDVGDFQFFVNAEYLNNTWTEIRSFKGSYQASLKPDDFTWTSECPNNLVVSGSKACYTPTTPGYCKICVSSLNSEQKCVSVLSAPLTLTPVNLNCQSCGLESVDCQNIPDPTVPTLTLSSTTDNSISVNWTNSISFTNGLYYELNINGNTQSTLATNVDLRALAGGTYNISIRAIDDCGTSAWSASQAITIAGITNGIIFDGNDLRFNTTNVVLN